MIKAPSIQHEYSLIFSGDPALILPADPEEKARLIRVAQETGDWKGLLGDEQPTIFQFRNLSRTQLGWFEGERNSCSWLNGRPLSGRESDDLMVRLALRGVENFGKHKVSFARINGQSIATSDIIDAIHDEANPHGEAVIGELAGIVTERALQQIRPL